MADLQEIYSKLFESFGPQHWWPGETPFEIMIGAILTQQTSWKNVEIAIQNLKDKNLLDVVSLNEIPKDELEKEIRKTGFYRQKSRAVKNFVGFLVEECQGDLDEMCSENDQELREKLLSVKGIGHETADSILLYACNKPFFVVDAYTKRALRRLELTDTDNYEEIRDFFESSLPKDAVLYNEFHALWVELGKRHCKTRPICDDCPFNDICPYPSKTE
ncbi:MAG: endonuclease III domain-containing protein [Thermoplasmata archaeon]|nr:endonuclease III domain-containing protein [Thermoplasmata archaeon]